MDCMWEGKEADEGKDNEAQGEHFPVFTITLGPDGILNAHPLQNSL